MGIIDRIRQARCKLQSLNLEPYSVVLGQDELEELKQWLKAMDLKTFPNLIASTRSNKILGFHIIESNHPSFFSVGIKD